jgi:hypothetical protein
MFMTVIEMKLLVRSVITIFAMPFAIVSVVATAVGWTVMCRAGTGDLVRFTISSDHPDLMRRAIRRRLEAEL